MYSGNLIGHKKVVSYFKTLHRTNRLAHAYIFSGNDGIGKRKTARHIAMLLNCLSADNSVCGECDNCYKIENKIHPDVIEIEPGKSISINTIRDLRNKVYIKKYVSDYKIVIIDNADLLTRPAANAFLKILEEPPPYTIFFLITAQPQNMLATVRSRAHKIWLSLKYDEALQFSSEKEGINIDPELMVRISSANLSRIEKMLSGIYLAKRKEIFAPAPGHFNIDERKRDDLKETAIMLLSFLRDCLIYKAGTPELIKNLDLEEKINRYQNRYNMHDILDKINSLLLVTQAFDNININLANNLIRSIL